MFCPSCGTKFEEGALFCPNCGTSFEEASAAIEKPAANFWAPATDDLNTPQTFAEETPAEEAPVEEAPVEEAPVEEAPVEETPVEEAPAEEAPVEEAPVEEAPVEEELFSFGSDDFDPRVFAGLDSVPAPPVFPDMEEAAQEAEAQEPRPYSEPIIVKQTKKQRAKQQAKQRPKQVADTSDNVQQKKKSKAGVIIAIVLAAIMLLAAAAIGFLWWQSTPLTEEELKQSFMENISLPKEQLNSESFTFQIKTTPPRQTDRLQLKDTVWCTITTQDENVISTQSYVMMYELRLNGMELSWELSAPIKEYAVDQWVVRPLKSASDDTIRQALVDQQITFDSGHTYTMTMEDATTAQIQPHEPDLENGTDTVQLAVNGTTDLLSWSCDVTVDLVFKDDWTVSSTEVGAVTWEMNPGKEFSLTEDDFKAEFVGKEFSVYAGSEDEPVPEGVTDQTITITEESLTQFLAKEPVFELEADLNAGTYTVPCELVINKSGAEISLKAELLYTFSDTEGAWITDGAVEYTSTLKSISLDGKWTGMCEIDAVSVMLPSNITLTVTTDDKDAMNGVLEFGPSEAATAIQPGSYHVLCTVDTKTLAVTLEAGEWVHNPSTGVRPVSLKGTLNLEDGTITGEEPFSIKWTEPLPETEPTPETEPAPETEAEPAPAA